LCAVRVATFLTDLFLNTLNRQCGSSSLLIEYFIDLTDFNTGGSTMPTIVPAVASRVSACGAFEIPTLVIEADMAKVGASFDAWTAVAVGNDGFWPGLLAVVRASAPLRAWTLDLAGEEAFTGDANADCSFVHAMVAGTAFPASLIALDAHKKKGSLWMATKRTGAFKWLRDQLVATKQVKPSAGGGRPASLEDAYGEKVSSGQKQVFVASQLYTDLMALLQKPSRGSGAPDAGAWEALLSGRVLSSEERAMLWGLATHIAKSSASKKAEDDKPATAEFKFNNLMVDLKVRLQGVLYNFLMARAGGLRATRQPFINGEHVNATLDLILKVDVSILDTDL
jgi:hypothetical protein